MWGKPYIAYPLRMEMGLDMELDSGISMEFHVVSLDEYLFIMRLYGNHVRTNRMESTSNSNPISILITINLHGYPYFRDST